MKKHLIRFVALTLTAALAVSPIMIHAEEPKTADLYMEDAESDEMIIFPEEEDETVDDADAMDIEISKDDDAETDEDIVDDMAEALDPEEADPVLTDGLFEEEETGDIDPEEAKQIRNIIDTTIEENKEHGLYATLNAIFKALADGGINVREDNLDALKDMIFEALKGNFDNTEEELLGAVGAAAERAKENGLVAVMACGMLSAASTTKSSWNEGSKYFKPIYDSAIDAIAISNPELKPFVPLFKALGGFIFNTGSGDRTDEVLDELNKLQTQITTAENNLKDHTYNVVALSDIGDKYNTVQYKAATIRTLIGNIKGDGKLSEEEKTQQIADLYKDAEFRSLMSAMNGATDCFYRDVNDIFETNLFDAAYNRACEEVMFSGEALTMTMPYIMKQFSYYTAAYATMGEVYDAYEEVYGDTSLTASRLEMAERLCGEDLDGNHVCKSVTDLIDEYFQRNRYIFVGKSNRTNIPVDDELNVLNGTLFVEHCIVRYYDYLNWCETPKYMSNSLLSTSQLKDIAEYCAQKNITIFDFLFNVMKFKPANPDGYPVFMETETGSEDDPLWYHRGEYYVPSGNDVFGTVYLVTGKSINKSRSGDSCRLDYEGVNALKVTKDVSNVKLASGILNYNLGIISHTYYYNTPIFFRRAE